MKLSNAQVRELRTLEQVERMGGTRVTYRSSSFYRTLQVLIRHGLAVDSTPDHPNTAHPLITDLGRAQIA